jgi:hypothetical protein
MYTCAICHFEVRLDDAVLPTTSGRCICLRCYTRELGYWRPMPKSLRRLVVAALEDLGVA